MQVNIQRQHTLGIEEAKRRVEIVAAELRSRFSLLTAWNGDRLDVSGSGVDGLINVTDTAVEARIRLGMSLKLFEGTIRSSIEKEMDDQFG